MGINFYCNLFIEIIIYHNVDKMRKLPPSGGCGGKQCDDRCKVQEGSFRYLPWSSLVLGCVHSHSDLP